MTTGCPFCQRIHDREYEPLSSDVVAFEPLNPITPGHMLVIPAVHVRDAAERPEVTADVMRWAAVMAARLDTDCNIITSIGTAATQTVFHLHVHVVPRREGDGLTLPWTGQARGG